MAKRKSFIISTLIILVMIVIGFNIPNIIDAMSDDFKPSEYLDEYQIGIYKKFQERFTSD